MARLMFSQDLKQDTLQAMFTELLSSRNPVPKFELSNPEYDETEDEPYGTWDVKIELPPDQARENDQQNQQEQDNRSRFDPPCSPAQHEVLSWYARAEIINCFYDSFLGYDELFLGICNEKGSITEGIDASWIAL